MEKIYNDYLSEGIEIHSDNFRDDTLLKAGLKLNHLRMIVTIEDHGQISAAAESMNMSQPAASRMLSEMESIVKSPLYERVARGVVLTPFGLALAKRARKILLELREAGRELGALRTGKGGSVFLGAVTAPAISLVVPAIQRVTRTYPGIEINIEVENSNVLARELLAARHDFIISRIPDDLDPRLFTTHEIGVEKACLVVRNGHPLLEKGVASLHDLAGYDWVFQPPGTLLRRKVEDIFLAAGVPLPENVVNTSSLLLTLAVVCKTDAIAPVALDMAQFICGQTSQAGESSILPIDFDIDVRPYSLITARERAMPPSARLLHDMILEESRHLSLS
ncbi:MULTISPECIES: LysR family transcriptional regulator [Rhizobium]|uniref:LysR family transcriptional regulator n=1 Tax=Rhizobium tropici TaxID=398 RepID=A0A329YFB8_RHITR|nr:MULTISPECIES: LysR family transcriptional regulator [Rhizobium]MBB3287809.1 DNA-binding transcriptional LysR family regulator [Rhizobium sp. BK252]MBB3402587.1 DNA-binding transcriptional LysR family regulator [Rhizobium sp. BK289]MBB3415163.1 DNA-binding transcriptional LysR family regulator [Rhizobium sp. BK284]MBB3483052.1 DNA-binding transcriptional LysR family regulator [Rhizobium sp. BK347]MDK4720677.1 LysR family transcriptional regulator [Rhizobium sp. CNPSo 3968]